MNGNLKPYANASIKDVAKMTHKLLQIALKSFPIYRYTPDILYHGRKPICNLNGLKQIRTSDEGLILEFEDAEPVMLGEKGVIETE